VCVYACVPVIYQPEANLTFSQWEVEAPSQSKANRTLTPTYIERHVQVTSIHDSGISHTGKGKAILVTGSGGPYGYETSRLPHVLDNLLIDGCAVVSLMHRSPLHTGRFLVLISVRG
jgi:hypothetical protein